MSDVDLSEEGQFQAHAHTFHSFMLGVKWFCIHLATLLAFLVITFCTGAGWGVGLLAAVVVLAVGIYAMNHGLAHSTEDGSSPRS
jgi:hypothetical protein